MKRTYTCASMNPATGGICGQEARPYICGPRCDPHSPWAMAGHTIPVPKPEWTAEGFRRRAEASRGAIPDNLPETCSHGEPKGPRYCALCKAQARKGDRP